MKDYRERIPLYCVTLIRFPDKLLPFVCLNQTLVCFRPQNRCFVWYMLSAVLQVAFFCRCELLNYPCEWAKGWACTGQCWTDCMYLSTVAIRLCFILCPKQMSSNEIATTKTRTRWSWMARRVLCASCLLSCLIKYIRLLIYYGKKDF